MKVKRKRTLFFTIIGAATLIGIILILNPFNKIFSGLKEYGQYASFGINFFNLTQQSFEDYYTDNQEKIDILHYDINIDLYPQDEVIRGDVTIKGTLLNKVIVIDLNFYDNFSIESISFNDLPADFSSDGYHLSIQIPETVVDTFLIQVIYEGEPKSLGLGSFNFGEYNNSSVVYTLSEPVFASTWYPCNDLPDDKALVDIKITNDSSKVSVSNGILVGVSATNGRRTFHWRTVYPISTYLISIYSADYIEFNEVYISSENDTMNVDYYVFPDHLDEAKTDFSCHLEAMNILSELFGEYPFIEEKYGVAEFLWQYGAMEHQTITGIGSNFVGGRKFFTDVYIHELAHQWWGNAVGPATWKDIWLNEGFATYSEALYHEKLHGQKALASTMLSNFGDFEGTTLYDPGTNLFSRIIYNKGAWVLHMLRREVGDQIFFEILRNYFNQYKYKNASTLDFKNLCESISNKKFNYFFNQWIFKGEGIIEIDYSYYSTKQSEHNYTTNLMLEQVQRGYDLYKFPLEIKFVFPEDTLDKKYYISDKQKVITFTTETIPDTIIFDPDHWLLANFWKSK